MNCFLPFKVKVTLLHLQCRYMFLAYFIFSELPSCEERALPHLSFQNKFS